MKSTPLYAVHKKLNAKMVPFAGWNMPVSYKGIIEEHQAVRDTAGLFDVSHMGIVDVTGEQALVFLQYVTVNDVSKLDNFQGQYSMILNHEGKILDDIIVSKLRGFYRVVVNSANFGVIWNWLEQVQKKSNFTDVQLNHRLDLALIAVQGPKSTAILESVFNTSIDIAAFRLQEVKYGGDQLLVSRTGYTGETGYEIFTPIEKAESLWNVLMACDAQPAGLGARDTLRIEAGLPLYGHEIFNQVTAYDLGYGWVIKLNKGDFIGRSVLANSDRSLKLFGCILDDRGIPRHGYSVLPEGTVTSGTYSPTLQKPVALIYSKAPLKDKETVEIEVRGRALKGHIVKLPFVKKKS